MGNLCNSQPKKLKTEQQEFKKQLEVDTDLGPQKVDVKVQHAQLSDLQEQQVDMGHL